MPLMNWLKSLFEPQVSPETATTKFSNVIFKAHEKTIRVHFKTSNPNEDVQPIIDGLLAALPNQDAFYSCVSNVPNGQKSRITVFLKPTDPDNVNNLHLRTIAKMLARHIKVDLVVERPENKHLLAAPSNTFT